LSHGFNVAIFSFTGAHELAQLGSASHFSDSPELGDGTPGMKRVIPARFVAKAWRLAADISGEIVWRASN
jgi:hypothetical protein